ncbi:MAG: polymerase sigma-70 factor, subfamily [Acidobacteriota bacterium]|jgi:RNA polymerase sigma-70 factor (ECF subfamily)|nr:polymerase sigma-70 factor, subfamily [Acidobacteriota bacterium]
MLGGCAESFGALYDRRQGGVYRFALRMTGSEAFAEDVTQDVFLALMREGCRFDPSRGSVKSYLYGMARYRVLRRLERERAHVAFEEDEGGTFDELPRAADDPFADLAREELVNLVRQAVLTLPTHFREVIVLCHLQEMNYAEAAEVLACPVGTVRSRLARARALLAGKLRALKETAVGERVVKAGQAI